MSALLTGAEVTRLAERERTIERGLATFVDVGTALAEIRDDRLYRAQYDTFEDYCRRRWGLTRSRAYQMMEAASVVQNFGHGQAPETESQARELARVPAEQRAEVWQQTIERTDGKPTAAAIRETYRPDPPPAPDPLPAEIAEQIERRAEAKTAQVAFDPDDARRDAELDAAMEGTEVRFRRNFANAAIKAGELTQFDAERIAEVYGHHNWQRNVGDLLDTLRGWCQAVEQAHRNQQRSGLRVVNGGRI